MIGLPSNPCCRAAFVLGPNAPLEDVPPPLSAQRLAVRSLSADDLNIAAANPKLELSRTFVEGALGRGDRAYGVFIGGLLVSYLWRGAGPAPHVEGFWVRLDPKY